MRILLIHNYYGSSAPSGENRAFELERSVLERKGLHVRTFVRKSDDLRRTGLLGLVKGGLVTPWNPGVARSIRRTLEQFAPDVAHVHNTFPLISPAVFSGIGARAARVLTLHNYRLVCPSAILLRNGKVCTECLDAGSVRPAIRHGCYRRSRVATLPLAACVALHRALRTWQRHVDAFIVLSEFQREMMVRAGLPASRVWVKPHCYPGSPAQVPWSARGNHAVFAGRLSEEKGVAHLLDAWAAWGESAPELRIVGDGPLRSSLEARAASLRGRVTFLGQVAPAMAEAEIARARLLCMPSICFEGFGLVLREAFAFGTPAAVSNIGPLPRIVDHGRTGLVFPPADPASLLRVIRAAWDDGPALERMSLAARKEFERSYAEDVNHEQLMAIYQHAIEVQRERRRDGWT